MSVGTYKIPCSIIRGGSSKGIFFKESDLPQDLALREKIILRAFGSPDSRQIDGLAGANSLTSKVAIIGQSPEENAVNYTFGQVSITTKVIDWTGNCGNISSAVGMFAIQEGFVPLPSNEKERVTVKVYNTNTEKNIYVTMPVRNGAVITEGSLIIPGTVYPGAPFLVEFENPAGSVTGKLLPTGNPIDSMEIENVGRFTYSFVDAGNPVVFLYAEELGLKGTELPEEVEKMPEVLRKIEAVRARIVVAMGLADTVENATKISPAIPKIGFMAPAQEYTTSLGEKVAPGEVDLVARLASMQKMHRAYMVTGAVATSAASQIEGSVVWNVLSTRARGANKILIGQPYGAMEVTIDAVEKQDGGLDFRRVGVLRTARKILDGMVYVPKKDIENW